MCNGSDFSFFRSLDECSDGWLEEKKLRFVCSLHIALFRLVRERRDIFETVLNSKDVAMDEFRRR